MNTPSTFSTQNLPKLLSLRDLFNLLNQNHKILAHQAMPRIQSLVNREDSEIHLYYIPDEHYEQWKDIKITKPSTPRLVRLQTLNGSGSFSYRCTILKLSEKYNFHPILDHLKHFADFLFIDSSIYFEITQEPKSKKLTNLYPISMVREACLRAWMKGKNIKKGSTVSYTKKEVWEELQQSNPEIFSHNQTDFFKEQEGIIKFKHGRRKKNIETTSE